jgi:hypothetical protein
LSNDENQGWFKHSSRSLPLNDPIIALPAGFPGLLKSSFTQLKEAHGSKLPEMNSGPFGDSNTLRLATLGSHMLQEPHNIVTGQLLADLDGPGSHGYGYRLTSAAETAARQPVDPT